MPLNDAQKTIKKPIHAARHYWFTADVIKAIRATNKFTDDQIILLTEEFAEAYASDNSGFTPSKFMDSALDAISNRRYQH